MTFVLTITTIAISHLAVPGYATFDLCDAAGKNQIASADGLDVVKTYTCDLQSEKEE